MINHLEVCSFNFLYIFFSVLLPVLKKMESFLKYQFVLRIFFNVSASIKEALMVT